MVLYITMNGNPGTCGFSNAFALMYRRANGTSYDSINLKQQIFNIDDPVFIFKRIQAGRAILLIFCPFCVPFKPSIDT